MLNILGLLRIQYWKPESLFLRARGRLLGNWELLGTRPEIWTTFRGLVASLINHSRWKKSWEVKHPLQQSLHQHRLPWDAQAIMNIAIMIDYAVVKLLGELSGLYTATGLDAWNSKPWSLAFSNLISPHFSLYSFPSVSHCLLWPAWRAWGDQLWPLSREPVMLASTMTQALNV
jgi:hypothetical protein